MIKNILIIGLGMVGSSIIKAIKKYYPPHGAQNFELKIFAIDINQDSLNFALENKIIDFELAGIERDLSAIDLIIIATPLEVYVDIFDRLKDAQFSSELAIIDLGSVKHFIKQIIPPSLEKYFIPLHPIAGSEKSSIEFSSEDLFQGKKIIITEEKEKFLSHPKASDLLEIFSKIGSMPFYMDSRKHDYVYALVSHLPQFISFAHIFELKNIPDNNDAQIFWQKSLRINNSNISLWIDIFKTNKTQIMFFYQKFYYNLEKIKNIIENSQFSDFAILINKAMMIGSRARLSADYQVADNELQNFYLNQEIEYAFLEQNPEIVFRIILIFAYLNIEEIEKAQNFCGPGFCDFILPILSCKKSSKVISQFVANNQKELTAKIAEFME
jgi:prephenate dehydrogenase